MSLPVIPISCENSRKLRILHFSDLHLTPETNLGKETSHFQNSIRRATHDNGGAFDLIFVTGDMVDHPIRKGGNYRDVLKASQEFLCQIAEEHCLNKAQGLVVVPGNHDYRWSGNLPDAEAESIFGEVFRAHFGHRVFDMGNSFPILVACFDSNRNLQGATPLEFARGAIDISLLDSDSAAFDLETKAHKALRKIALVHHHPFPVPAAERTVLKSWLEKRLRVPLEGAPEYLLLRNAGVFMHKLLENDFQLLLHGHLHEPGFWRVHATSSDGLERWIEVISGASSMLGDERSFNSVLFSSEGVMDVKVYAWNREGLRAQQRRMPSATYDVLRERLNSSFRTEVKVAVKVYSQIWTVDLDDGDWEITDYSGGFYAIVDEPQASLRVCVVTSALNMTQFEALKAPSGELISLPPRPSKDEEAVEYHIKFDPPLVGDRRADVVCKYFLRGALFCSREDKEFFADGVDYSHDDITQEILRPTERLVIRLKFRTKKPERIPREVKFEVLDSNGRRSEDEQSSGHVIFDYWKPSNAPAFSDIPSEAVLTIVRPRQKYKYVLKWPLPSDANFKSVPVERFRGALLSFGKEPGKIRDCQIFLTRALDSLKDYCPMTEDIALYLFAFDQGTKELEPIASLGALDSDASVKKKYRYGHDVVGACFRRRCPLAFSRSDSENRFFMRPGNDDLCYFIAGPLFVEGYPDAPAGVFALASKERKSKLFECCSPDRMKTMFDGLNVLFQTTFQRALLA